MVHTVGLMGANGRVGASAANYLAKSAAEGKIKLIILHRAGSPPKGIGASSDIELRVVDLDDPAPALDEAVKGINIFISAVALTALASEPKLVDALSRSPDFVTFVPSAFSTEWTAEDKADPALGAVISFIHSGWDHAVSKGLGITAVYTGLLDQYAFEYGFVASAVKENSILADKQMLRNRVPVTTVEHLGQALDRIATKAPESIKNTVQTVVTFWPTGQDVVDLYTKVNGAPTTVNDYTPAVREELRADAANFGAAKAGYKDHWQKGDYSYEGNGQIVDRGYVGPDLETVIRAFA